MKINKDNYEMFFLDYHEGTLPAELVAELFLFLEQNPALKSEFETFENILLPDAKVIEFPGKDLLKRGNIDENNYSWYFIGHVEGNLSAHEELMLQSFLKSFPAYQSDLELFKKTKLQPDLSVTFSDKRDLKKPVPLFGSSKVWYYVAAAACIIFLLGVFFINQDNQGGSQMADQDKHAVVDPGKDSLENSSDQKNKLDNRRSPENEKALTAQDNDGQKNNQENNHVNKIKNMKSEKNPGLNQGATFQKQLAVDQKLRNKTNRQKIHSPNFIQPLKENMAYMQPIEMNLVSEKQEVSLAGSENKKEPGAYYTLTASIDNQPVYPTIGKLLSQYSKEKFKQTINNKPLADELLSNRTPRKVKSIKFIGWCYEQLTGKKVKVKTTYSPEGELTAYHISSGRFKYGKTFASQ